jgi:hypothetical protein
MGVALVLGAARIGVALALLGAAADASTAQGDAGKSSLCIERSASRRPDDPKLPVRFSLAARRGAWRMQGEIQDHEQSCFNAPPGRVKIKYELPATELPQSRPCRRTMEAVADPAHPYQFFVGRPEVPGEEACPWVYGGHYTDEKSEPENVKKDFVTLAPISSYAAARDTARRAAKRLDIRLALGESRPHGKGKLTFSKAMCDANEWGYPCYVARGRYDDGVYVSIDVASAFPGVPGPGYIVVLASGPKDDPAIRALFEKARSSFPEASIQTNDVYMGCIH